MGGVSFFAIQVCYNENNAKINKSAIGSVQNMKFFKKLTQISSSAVRLAIGIGGALLIFLAVKDKPDQLKSKDKQPKKE